jgi:hypothetical protein
MMSPFAEKHERVKILHGFASADLTANAGDIVELSIARASELLSAGWAELAPPDAEVGPAVFPNCWRCGSPQAFPNPRCDNCGIPI